MAKGPLRIALESFVDDNPIIQKWRDYWGAVQERETQLKTLRDHYSQNRPGQAIYYNILLAIPSAVYVWFGIGVADDFYKIKATNDEVNDTAQFISEFWQAVQGSGPVSDMADIMGAFVSEPLLQVFETVDEVTENDPKILVRRFHTLVNTMSAVNGVLASAVEAGTLGQMETVSKMFSQVYWNFGIGFLGWQTLAPALTAGMQAQLERYYNEKFRPERFNASELRDLYALGKLTEGQLRTEAKKLGWRDDDIQKWVDLAYRQLSESDIWALYHAGEIDATETSARLQGLGFSAADIPHLFTINERDDVSSTKAVSKSTAQKAYREGLISAEELSAFLQALDLNADEIALIIALEDMNRAQEIRSLSVAQIRSAWQDNILTDAEARYWLGQENFGTAEIDILLQTWQAEIAPKFVKLNRSTILGAYVEAILNRTEASAKLQSIGLTVDDAGLELDLVEARNPAAFGAPAPKPNKNLTVGILTQMVQEGLIIPSIMKTRLIEMNYSEADADALMSLAIQKAEQEPRILTQFSIERAYAAGILNRTEAADKLVDNEFEPDDIAIILDTVEQENPAVFAPETITALRIPSITALVQALQSEIITEAEYYAKAAAIGFQETDASMYLSIAIYNERKGSKTLSASQIGRAYERGIFGRGIAQERLNAQGYNDADADIFLRLYKSGVTDTEVWANMASGLIDPEDGINQLLGMGFTIEEIMEAIDDIT